jgi:hypothetical protein
MGRVAADRPAGEDMRGPSVVVTAFNVKLPADMRLAFSFGMRLWDPAGWWLEL